MVPAQTNGHDEDKTYRDAGKNTKRKKRKTKSRKQGTKASKQENRTQGVAIASNQPVSATKPRRGPCHINCDLLPALVGLQYLEALTLTPLLCEEKRHEKL